MNLPRCWIEALNKGTESVAVIHDKENCSPKEILHNTLKVSAVFYKHIICRNTSDYDHGKVSWQVELGIHWEVGEWNKIRKHIFGVTMATKFHYFQFRILSKKLTTNYNRHKWDNAISPMCYFCNEKVETTIHIMWECVKVNKFWKQVCRWIEYVCKIKCKITAVEVITNMSNLENTMFIDEVLIVGKQYIYATKCLQGELNVNNLVKKLYTEYVVEKSIAGQRDKYKLFAKKWNAFEVAIK